MLILGNGRVVTRNPECPYMEEGAVAIVSFSVRFLSSVHHIPSRMLSNPVGLYPLIASPLAKEL